MRARERRDVGWGDAGTWNLEDAVREVIGTQGHWDAWGIRGHGMYGLEDVINKQNLHC